MGLPLLRARHRSEVYRKLGKKGKREKNKPAKHSTRDHQFPSRGKKNLFKAVFFPCSLLRWVLDVLTGENEEDNLPKGRVVLLLYIISWSRFAC